MRRSKNSIFLNDFGSWKIWSEEKKPEANFFGSEGFNSTQLFWILKTQKMLAEGFFFLNSKFWSWKGVQNELFLYWITFLPCSYEAKVKNKILFFPREKRILFFPDSPNTIRNGAGKKSNPLYKKSHNIVARKAKDLNLPPAVLLFVLLSALIRMLYVGLLQLLRIFPFR